MAYERDSNGKDSGLGEDQLEKSPLSEDYQFNKILQNADDDDDDDDDDHEGGHDINPEGPGGHHDPNGDVEWATEPVPLSGGTNLTAPDVVVRIQSQQTGFCLDSAGDSNNGGRVYQWEANGNNHNQFWRFVSLGGGVFRIQSVASGLFLDTANETSDGGKIHQWGNNGNDNDNQKWRLKRQGQDIFRIYSVASGKCIDAAFDGRNGGKVYQWTDNGNDNNNQKWLLRIP